MVRCRPLHESRCEGHRVPLVAFPISIDAERDTKSRLPSVCFRAMEEATTPATFHSLIGRRIHVIGNTCAGKSTLATQVARRIDAAFVELDALNWLPNWIDLTQTDPQRFEQRVRDATAGDAWVVAGSYSEFCQRVFWPRLDTVVWLDLPLPTIVTRVVRRSIKRYRDKELLWGTNRERLWPQLKFWHHDSLIHWAVSQSRRKRRWMLAQIFDPRWSQIRFIRLQTPREVAAFVARLDAEVMPGDSRSQTV